MTAPNDVAALVAKLRYQAMEAAKRFIDWRFGNDNAPPRISIPARPDYDDDLVLVSALKEAATTIAGLQAEVERAKEALAPFAEHAAAFDHLKPEIIIYGSGGLNITVADLCRARSASRKENTP